ncbi:MAG: hypothetical protein AAGG51_29125 [Cyanobacteria bacterium P01_G01_bin.54]
MPQTQLQTPETVLQAEFVESTSAIPSAPSQPTNPTMGQPAWQRRKNGVGYTFHKELAQLEGRLEEQFTGLHQHLHQQSTTHHNAVGQWFGTLDANMGQQFRVLDRKLSQKLNLVLATQRAQSSRRSVLWLMGTLAAAGVYIIVLHPLLSPPQPRQPSAATPPASTPMTLPTPNPPLPGEVRTP